jgi:hypothetical protein
MNLSTAQIGSIRGQLIQMRVAGAETADAAGLCALTAELFAATRKGPVAQPTASDEGAHAQARPLTGAIPWATVIAAIEADRKPERADNHSWRNFTRRDRAAS